MIKNITEGHSIIKVEQETNAILQVGSQGMSGIYSAKARELYKSGIIGDLVMVEIFNDRYSSEGAWQYPIPPDASPDTIDFDTFLGSAPKVKYDPIRFFRWRNYQDYGTGVAGDLFVHSFSTLNFVIDSLGPKSAKSTGGLRYWKDGRDVPDIMMSLYDFPKTDSHPEFNAVLRINFIASNGGGGGFRLVGTEGAMTVGWTSVSVVHNQMGWKPTGYALKAYSKEMQMEINKIYDAQYEKLVKVPEMIREIIEQVDLARFDRAHFRSYGDSSLDFEIVYWVKVADYNTYMDIQQRINLEMFRRFGEESCGRAICLGG